jgi:hypothetical protein
MNPYKLIGVRRVLVVISVCLRRVPTWRIGRPDAVVAFCLGRGFVGVRGRGALCRLAFGSEAARLASARARVCRTLGTALVGRYGRFRVLWPTPQVRRRWRMGTTHKCSTNHGSLGIRIDSWPPPSVLPSIGVGQPLTATGSPSAP